MLVQIFHAFQRTTKFTGYAGTSEFLLAKVSILPLPVASSPDSAFLRFPQIQHSPLKKTSSFRQA
jgi:hypothetical protein